MHQTRFLEMLYKMFKDLAFLENRMLIKVIDST